VGAEPTISNINIIKYMILLEQSGISKILIIVIIVGILVGGGLIWYYQKTLQIISKPALQISPTNETANWKTYINTNTKYGFEFKYPKEYGEVRADYDPHFPSAALAPGVIAMGANVMLYFNPSIHIDMTLEEEANYQALFSGKYKVKKLFM
jgi:hypothetical protein